MILVIRILGGARLSLNFWGLDMRVTCSDCQIEATVISITGGSTVCPECGKELPVISSDSSLTVTRMLGAVPESAEVPDYVGKYKVIRKVAQGGCGIVYLARDEQLACDIAIKVPRFEKGDQSEIILKEARTLAKLRHPNIVRVLAADQTEDGKVFIVMDWIEGQTLRDLMTDRQLSVEETGALISKVAEAVHIAHKA